MILAITTTHRPATDLGYLLHKNPARVHTTPLPFGRAHVVYPEATAERCTATLLLDVDPVGLVRRPAGSFGTVREYVNDRPYVASSLLSVAIARALGTAMAGRSKDRPELAQAPLPLEARLPVVPSRRGGEALLRRLFEPLGYAVTVRRHPLDTDLDGLGPSDYFALTLRSHRRLSELLTHLYVLVPVLDEEKHYWIGDDEVDKLVRHGEGWLASHPERELIAHRYLRYRSLIQDALARLVTEEQPQFESVETTNAVIEQTLEEPLRLRDLRLTAVVAALKESGARRVLDLGCGEGALLQAMLRDSAFEELVGVDVSHRALEVAARRLDIDRLPARQRQRIRLLHGSLTYRDRRLEGYDAAALVEVIEHIDAPRLPAFERSLLGSTRPRVVVLTTPNAEYNARFEHLAPGRFRHADHRFEWTRRELEAWARAVGQRHGYAVDLRPIGAEDPTLGPPTQMAVLTRE